LLEGFNLDKPKSFEERERILTAISAALGGAFVLAVAVPPTLLHAGSKRHEVYYQSMRGTFLIPLIDLHKELGIQRLHIRLRGVGKYSDQLLEQTKQAMVWAYPRKSGWSVDLLSKKRPLCIFEKIFEHLGWAVGRLYNNNQDKWVSLLQRDA
jgi:hypothetical protein